MPQLIWGLTEGWYNRGLGCRVAAGPLAQQALIALQEARAELLSAECAAVAQAAVAAGEC